jgi:hypothetical protein
VLIHVCRSEVLRFRNEILVVRLWFEYAPLEEIIGKLRAGKIRCGIRGMRAVEGSVGLDMEKDPVLKGSGLPVA